MLTIRRRAAIHAGSNWRLWFGPVAGPAPIRALAWPCRTELGDAPKVSCLAGRPGSTDRCQRPCCASCCSCHAQPQAMATERVAMAACCLRWGRGRGSTLRSGCVRATALATATSAQRSRLLSHSDEISSSTAQ